jgi:hypothetical protein
MRELHPNMRKIDKGISNGIALKIFGDKFQQQRKTYAELASSYAV